MGRSGQGRREDRGPTTTRRVVLETARLRLEPVGAAHAEGLYRAVVDSRPELLPWMPWAREPTLAGNIALTARDEQAWREDRFYHFAVVEKGSDVALGIVGVNREGRDAPELHYWIRTDHAGRGLATEAARGLIEWARDELHAPRLRLWAGSENHASRRVAEKLGFVHIGALNWRPEGGLGDFPAESYELVLTPG